MARTPKIQQVAGITVVLDKVQFCLGVLTLLVTACGYQVHTQNKGEPLSVYVAPVRDLSADPDLGPLLDRHLRLQVDRLAGVQLVNDERALRHLVLREASVSRKLSGLADPVLRAAPYQASVRLRLEYVVDSQVIWSSSEVEGLGPFLSTPGKLEVLDGASRVALERAIEDAVAQLTRAWAIRLRHGPQNP